MKLYELIKKWAEGNISGKVSELEEMARKIKKLTKTEIEEIYEYFPQYAHFKGTSFDELAEKEKRNELSENEQIVGGLFLKMDEVLKDMEEEKQDTLTWENDADSLRIIIIEKIAVYIYKNLKDETRKREVKKLVEQINTLHDIKDGKEKENAVEVPGNKKSNTEAMQGMCSINRKIDGNEVIEMVEISDLQNLTSFVHPYAKSLDENEEAILALSEDIKLHGVISPIIARKFKGGRYYEILSGHRRTKAAKLAGLEYIPAIVKRNITDEEAICIITDNENQRKDILPSEKAKAYKLRKEILDTSMKLAKNESAENVGISTENEDENLDCTGCNRENGVWTDTEEGKQMLASLGVEYRTFYNYMKLNDLTDELLNMVDDKIVPIKVAVQLGKLDSAIQEFMALYLQTEKLSEKEAGLLAKEQQTLIGYKNAGKLDVLSVKNLIKDNFELEKAEKEKGKKAKINMTKIFGEIRKKCNSYKGNEKKLFSQITEERFREIVTKAVEKAIENEFNEMGKKEIDRLYPKD